MDVCGVQLQRALEHCNGGGGGTRQAAAAAAHQARQLLACELRRLWRRRQQLPQQLRIARLRSIVQRAAGTEGSGRDDRVSGWRRAGGSGGGTRQRCLLAVERSAPRGRGLTAGARYNPRQRGGSTQGAAGKGSVARSGRTP